MNNLWNKRIPTLFGLIAIVAGIAITSFLTKQGTLLTGNASPSDAPQNVQISNVSDTSFTVAYTTSDSVIGSLNYGETSSMGTTAIDDRDKTPTPHKSHYITVKNLKPQTQYYFSIISGTNTYLNNGTFYSIKTGVLLNPSNAQQRGEVSGKAIFPDGSSAKDTIVLLTIPGAQSLITITKDDGSYSMGVNLLRNSDLTSYFNIPSDAILKLTLSTDSLLSSAKLSKDEASFVPTITLSKNYDFTTGNTPLSIAEPATSSANIAFPTANPSAKTNISPEILTPKKDQSFSDDQPLFKGTALPNQDIQITIHSDQAINATVTSDGNGNWSYRPDSSLTPGVHTISITTKDAFGILKTITQQFTVYASGSQVGESATPSATLTPSAAPTITTAPVASQTPTITITPTQIATATPTAVLPPTGSSSAQALGIFGVALLVIGALLFILTRIGI